MEFYLLGGICAAVLLLLYFFLTKNATQVRPDTISPDVEKNIQILENTECRYSPEMRITLHAIPGEKSYNEMISALEEKMYEVNALFHTLRYTIERTEFGEFMTAAEIFELLNKEKEIEKFKKYVDSEIELDNRVKKFIERKRDVEESMSNILYRTRKMRKEKT
jgi:hypothetical protein